MSKILIVGGVAGGATTAARLRRIDESAEIIVFERGDYVSYANCGLPYYIGGVIKERENLFVMTAERLKKRLNIDVRIKNEVIAIDRVKKTLKIKNHFKQTEYEESYDVLVLAPGAEPVRPPISGIDSKLIFTLRNVPDTDRIKKFVDDNKPENAVVIGGGFIGLEMAENLHHRGVGVTLVEATDQVMAPLDYEMAAIVHNHIRSKGVDLILRDGVSSFNESAEGIVVRLSSGKEIKTKMVILSIGVKPDTKIAKEAGLSLTERGFIMVNEFMQTSDEKIYALGDAVVFKSPITGKYQSIPLAGPANKQGRIVADNIFEGNKYKFKGSIGTAIAKVFDLTVASTGFPEKTLKNEGIKYFSNITHSGNHAGYYPMSIPLSLKIVFSPEGKILGAQAVGHDGVDKRIDIIATTIGLNGTVDDLCEMEHAYAPPFSSAKDPVNIAAFAAQNILKGKIKTVNWSSIANEDKGIMYLLDVRTPDEHKLGAIEGSVNIPVDDLRSRLDEVPKNKKIIVYCAVGLRGYFAARILVQKGYSEVYNLSGGFKTYQNAVSNVNKDQSKERVGKDDMIYSDNKATAKTVNLSIDACGLQCPGPIVKLKSETDKLNPGDRILVKATDPGFKKDVVSWCNMTGNHLVSVDESAGIITAMIEKGGEKVGGAMMKGNDKTIVVFSDDLDRALASFVIANGAAASGRKVTMFFTFWGLSILKKSNPGRVKKDFFGKMFGMMLPGGTKSLGLSKMNFGGIGAKLMRFIMRNKKIESVEEMMNTARASGVEMIACQMSMDVMGVKKEELFDFVTIGGVASFLEASDTSNMSLFI